MSGATEHLPRLLALVPWLLAHPNTPVGDVAKQFDVTERQIRADLDLLFVCGLPGHGPGDLMDVVYDGDRVSLSNADTIGQPLRLVSDEALALVAALRALLGVPGLVDTAAVDRALAKLEAAAGGVVGPAELSVATDAAADPATVATVTDALAKGHRLRMTYWVPARDESTEREVDPIRMFTGDGTIYLRGWCHAVEDMRTFRLDRVLAITDTGVSAGVPDDVRRRGLDSGLFTPAADDRLITLELQPAARWVADYYPCETVVEAHGGGLVVQLRARDDDWVRRLALGLAGYGRVVDPPDLVRYCQTAAAAALAGYAPNGRRD
jgi:proteasome accessory factor C